MLLTETVVAPSEALGQRKREVTVTMIATEHPERDADPIDPRLFEEWVSSPTGIGRSVTSSPADASCGARPNPPIRFSGQMTTTVPSPTDAVTGARPALAPRRFQPALTLGHQMDLLALAEDARHRDPPGVAQLMGYAIGVAEARRVTLSSAGVPAADLRPTAAYVAALKVLRDLVAQGWTIVRDNDGMLLAPPVAALGAADDPSVAKGGLRASFSFARRAHLAVPSTARFVEGMERKGIDRLMADGPELAARLGAGASGGVPLDEAVRPFLQPVDSTSRDEATGLRLMDVWRYMRLHWSIPYQSTPGRNLYYLVRDDAGPDRPVIGIAALGNAVLGLTARDEALGLTAEALRQRFVRSDGRQRRRLLDHLRRVVQDGFENVLHDDLPLTADRGDVDAVSLRAVEKEATWSRNEDLRAAQSDRTDDYEVIRDAHNRAQRGEPVDWEAVARTNLYRRKRAGTLAEIAEAETALSQWTSKAGIKGLGAMLEDPEGRRGVEAILRRVRQRAIAENLMEVITCGAVPPYGDVLGGKLVAMLLCAPAVTTNFADRYDRRTSLIASGLAGRPVSRRAQLAVLTTSSLYSVGSSQYNRIRLPAETLGGAGDVRYKRIGTTESFGTVHFAPDTAQALTELARLANDGRRSVNNLFGEGMSPKLRSLRMGFEALGLPADVFLRHHSPRLLYAARLAHNATDVLLGLDKRPDSILGAAKPDGGVEEVAEMWRERWLRPRILRDGMLERVADSPRAEMLLGKVTSAAPGYGLPNISAPGALYTQPSSTGQSPTEFVERLYRAANSYADRLSPDELEQIDVDLGLGAHLASLADDCRHIIVTGNPGDGKTHLIERLHSQLEAAGAVVIADANELTDDQLLDTWEQCERDEVPLVLAINEWPLFALHRHPRGAAFAPLAEALRQVRQSSWHLTAPEPPKGRVRVIDLSLRNLLAKPVVLAVIDRLTDERFFEGVNSDDPAAANREALASPLVRGRVAAVLDRVARNGHHATMRQLVGFVAYLLTGGRSDVQRLADQGDPCYAYSTLFFEGGEGPLFRAVRDALDPATQTHPDHDFALWRGEVRPGGWTVSSPPSGGVQEIGPDDRVDAFKALKRRFFFEHEDAGELLELLPADEVAFDRLAEEGQGGDPQVVRDIVEALNKFFEPDSTDNETLTLWQSHRYDVRAPEAFIALRQVSRDDFTVKPDHYAGWVDEWLPADQRLQRTFAVHVPAPAIGATASDGATILIDRNLFLTLTEAQRGLGRAGWSRSATRRITRFVDRLQNIHVEKSEIVDIRIRNVATDLDDRFEVRREPPSFNL